MDSPLTTESETRRFLAEFARYAKPKTVIETGCHLGHTAHELSSVLWGHSGTLYTCDTEPEFVRVTKERCENMPVIASVMKGTELIQSMTLPIEMAFLDSGANMERAKEAVELIPKMAERFWVFLHDALQAEDPCFQAISELTGWNTLLLPYGRGLGMFWR